MRNSPSKIVFQDASKIHEIPSHLIDKSRSKYCDLFKLIDTFEQCSEEYVDNSSLNKLFQMAETILPISESTALIYCRIILNKNPFHKEARMMCEELEKAAHHNKY